MITRLTVICVLLGGVAVAAGCGGVSTHALPVAAGASILGSSLRADSDVDSKSCDAAGEEACTITQHSLIVPADGVVVAWSVRGAKGRLTLQVLRDVAGAKSFQSVASQSEAVPDVFPYRYKTRLAVRRGDRLGLLVAAGAKVGLRRGTGGVTERWLPALLGTARAGGTGPAGELQLRIEFVAG